MPFIKVYIHFVWSTKNSIPFLATKKIRETVWNHIRENAKEKGIHIDFINGYEEHCHCVVYLGVDQTIQKVMQLIKGNLHFGLTSKVFFRNYLHLKLEVKKNSNGKKNILPFQLVNLF